MVTEDECFHWQGAEWKVHWWIDYIYLYDSVWRNVLLCIGLCVVVLRGRFQAVAPSQTRSEDEPGIQIENKLFLL